MSDYFSESNLVQFYSVRENDFYIQSIGYNDFHTEKPILSFWMQNHFTMHFVLSGCGTLIFDDKKFLLKQGDLFILPPYEKHCYFPSEKEPWTYFWFDFKGDNAEKYYSRIVTKNGGENVFNISDSNNLFDLFLKEFGGNEKIGYYKTLSLFYSVLDKIDIDLIYCTEPNIIEDIEKAIALNVFSVEFSVASLCKIVHLSHSNLCFVYKKSTGRTVKDRMTELKMNKAMNLIMSTDKKIKDIAYEVGYADELNFMKMFKCYFGKSATSFRK